MNKILLSFFLFFAMTASFTANAQFFRVRELPKHDISLCVGYGGGKNPYNCHLRTCPAINNSSVSRDAFRSDEFYTSFNAIYLRNITNRLGVGLHGGCSSTREAWDMGHFHLCSDHYGYVMARIEETCLYVMPAARWYFLNHAHWAVYARLAMGVNICLVREKDLNPHDDLEFNCGKQTEIRFAQQSTLLGVEWGGSLIRGFAELGNGNQGVFTIGVKASF